MKRVLNTEGYSLIFDDSKWNGVFLKGNGFSYEAHIRDWIHLSVKGKVFVNVGANYGIHVFNAYRAGAKKILAFEVVPEVFDMLNEAMTVNKMSDKVSCYRIAVGDRKGIATLVCGTSDNGVVNWCARNEGEEYVNSDTLTPYLEPFIDEEVVFVIDAEGSEFRVIRGMQAFVEKKKPKIIFEILREMFLQQEVLSELTWLSKLGYSLRIFNRPNQRGLCSNDPKTVTDRIYSMDDSVVDVELIPPVLPLFATL